MRFSTAVADAVLTTIRDAAAGGWLRIYSNSLPAAITDSPGATPAV